MANPVCIVTGVGPEHGTGAEIARRFAAGGYQTAMIARDADRLADLEGKYENATAFPCDLSDIDAIIDTVARIRTDLGAPEIVIHNAPQASRGPFLEVDPETLEQNFRVNTTALLYLARETSPNRSPANSARKAFTSPISSWTRRSARRAPGRSCFRTNRMNFSPIRRTSRTRCSTSPTSRDRPGPLRSNSGRSARSGKLRHALIGKITLQQGPLFARNAAGQRHLGG